MEIILFSGKAESGKTLAAKITKERLEAKGYKVVKLSYGDYVKQTAKMLFEWDGQKDEAGRALLQWWGIDFVRDIEPDFWVDTIIRLCDVIRNMYNFVIIDDARYENEIDRWMDYDYCATAVRVERPSHENILSSVQREHISETSLDNYPFNVRLIANDSAELEKQVNDVLINKIIFASAEDKQA
jgi:hypothetical protein